uniref:GGDEF domain-containing protein n=1 Tax=Thermogemmatispora argillosa TaxID=2045280 RepID=A0A455T5D8_9CHLR|nr:hypothetical protein KTA_08830 [Thermogemmatispora argillosa]
MTESYMLIFTLGPVQSFIAQARKSRDLWLGSFLLSHLMEAALAQVPQEALVFPTTPKIDRSRWIPDLPNRYVAVFPSPERPHPDPLTLARQTAEQSEQAIYAAWQDVCKGVYKQLFGGNGPDGHDLVLQAIWERQTDPRHLFEIYWAIAPNTDAQGLPLAYGDWFKRTSQALDARKSLRDFAAQDEPGEKSTLSGKREALHSQGESRQEVRAFWIQVAAKPVVSAKDLAPDGSERLDAIDTVKRFALLSESFLKGQGESKNGQEESKNGQGESKPGSEQGLDFPSTSTMAAATFLKRLLALVSSPESPSSEIQEAVKGWQAITAQLASAKPHLALPYLEKKAQQSNASWLKGVDGECAFIETFTAQRLRTNYRAVLKPESSPTPRGPAADQPDYLLRAHEVLRQLYRLIGAPSPYYALLQMDGDQMGTLIGEVQSQQDHRAISKALSTFARKHVPAIVEDQRPGKLIYAGGDDVLALAPLAQVFAIASGLQRAYHEIVGSQVQKVTTRKATASMGIAIAHHLMPLTLVRRMAREAEEQAKHRYGRNALVVTLLWRSGITLSAGCQWKYQYTADSNDSLLSPLQIFEQMAQLFASGTLSPRCLESLNRELPGLQGLPDAALRSELARVFRRHWNQYKYAASQAEQTPERESRREEAATGLSPASGQQVATREAIRELPSDPEEASLLLAHQLVTLVAAMKKTHAQAFAQANSAALATVLNWLQILAFLAREAGDSVSFH